MHRWVVTDLQSTHGMFVRVSRTVLADRAEFLVGNGRYRFESPQALRRGDRSIQLRPSRRASAQTQGWADGPSPFRAPAVTELIGNEIGNRMLLVKPEYWIGSDPTCPICRPDDPFCEPRHVRLFRGSERRLARRAQQDPERPLAADGRRSSSIPWSGSRSASSGSSSRCSHGKMATDHE